MCILYVYVCLSLDERRSIEDTPTCSSAAPQIPFCCWKSLFIPNIKEAQFFTKKHLSPSWTFPMHHLQQSLRSPNSNCCMLSSCDSQPNNFSILRVDFFGASGKHRGKMKDNFLGVAEWFSFKKKERYLSVKSLVYKSCSIRKIIWTNHPPPFFCVPS